MDLKKTLVITGAAAVAVSAIGAGVFLMTNKTPDSAETVISKAMSNLEKLEKDNFHMDMKKNIIGNVDYTGVNGNIKMDFPIHSTTTLDIAGQYAKGTTTTEANFEMNCEMNEFAQSFVGSSLNDDLSIHESNNVHIALDDDGNFLYTKNMTEADVPWNKIKANKEKFDELMNLMSIFEKEDVQNVLKNGELTANEDGYLVQVPTDTLINTETFKKLMAPVYEQQLDESGNPLPSEYRNKIVRLIELFKSSANMEAVQDSIEKASANSKVIFQFSKKFELIKIATSEISISIDSILDKDKNNTQHNETVETTATEPVTTESISTETVVTEPIENNTEDTQPSVDETMPAEQEHNLDTIDAPILDETPDAGEVNEETTAQTEAVEETIEQTEPQQEETQTQELSETEAVEEELDYIDENKTPTLDHPQSDDNKNDDNNNDLNVSLKCQFSVEFSKVGEVDTESVKPTEKIVLGSVVGKDLLSIDTNMTIDDVLVPFVILNRDLEVEESKQPSEETPPEPMHKWEEDKLRIGDGIEYSMSSSPLELVETWIPVIPEDAKHEPFKLYPFVRTTDDGVKHVMHLAYINKQTIDGLADDSFAYIINVSPKILGEDENSVLENITLGGDITIGSTEEDVVAAYGEPFTKTDYEDYSNIIYYGNQKSMMLCLEMKDNVVAGITIEFYGD